MQISAKRSDKTGFLLQICFYGADHWPIFYLASSAEPIFGYLSEANQKCIAGFQDTGEC